MSSTTMRRFRVVEAVVRTTHRNILHRSTYPLLPQLRAEPHPVSSSSPKRLFAQQHRRQSTQPAADGILRQDWLRPGKFVEGDGLRRTALYDLHRKRGAKMVPFAGYSMPLQYEGQSISESHRWTRERASLFDVGHMYA